MRGQVGRLRMESRLLAQALDTAKLAGGDNWADKERMFAQRLGQLKRWLSGPFHKYGNVFGGSFSRRLRFSHLTDL